MPEYKLYYFDVRARAELARYVFALGDAKYEDIRLTGESWTEFKPKTTCGQMPVLFVDGQQFSQSIPIAVYLAGQFGLAGKGFNDFDNFRINEIISIAGDTRDLMIKAFMEKDEAKKAELGKKFKTEDLPKYLGIFEKLLVGAGGDYFVSKKLSLADLVVFDLLAMPLEQDAKALDATPKLKANYDRVANNPKIKAWIAKRPKTKF